ncbi:MAG: Fic family protein [Deltaproteobacteria bacterium]|nr:Fic family protein [Deltaproteobacteria bacterium]
MKPYVPKQLALLDIDWADHVSLIGAANAALARYDGLLSSIVNPGVLLSPLTTREAVLSSRIEGTQATLEEVLEYEADPTEKIDPVKQADIQEIINYRQAMRYAVEQLKHRPLCLNLLRELHGVLLDSVRGRNKAPGEFRRIQNYIGPPGCSIEEATFVPPAADKLAAGLDDWEKYVHFDEKDRLVQLAVVKAQFELIHPFLDGNGRVGRMLIPIFLFEKKLLSSPMFYLSAYLEAHREVYYERLRSISHDNDWNGWIRFFLNALIEQAHDNTAKAKAILALYERMKREVPEITHSQYAIQAIDALFDLPVFTSARFITRSNIPNDTAKRILSALKAKGTIHVLSGGRGRRGAMMVFPQLLAITEADPFVDH